jgi:mycothiol synthase
LNDLRIAWAESDADLAHVVAIRTALAPAWESGPTIENLRHHLTVSPELRLYLALAGGEPVGCGAAGPWIPGEEGGSVEADAGVLPEHRRRGIGTALLRQASTHVRSLGREALLVEVREDDDESLRYVQRRGFTEIERQKAVVLELAGLVAPPPEEPPGIRIVSRAERPDLVRSMYEAGLEAGRDIPGRDGELEPSYEDWHAFEIARPSRAPELAFLALDGDVVVGFASLDAIGGVGYNGLTAVRRAYRRRGIARALKQAEIAAAVRAGLPRLVTESEERNEPMRRLNHSLGYRPAPGAIVLEGPLLA